MIVGYMPCCAIDFAQGFGEALGCVLAALFALWLVWHGIKRLLRKWHTRRKTAAPHTD